MLSFQIGTNLFIYQIVNRTVHLMRPQKIDNTMNQDLEKNILDGEMLGRFLSDPEESNDQEKINDWLAEDAHRKLYDEITTTEFVREAYQFHQSIDPVRELELFGQKYRRNQFNRFLPYISVAAVLAIVLVINILNPQKEPILQTPVPYTQHQIQPGRSKAILVLDNNQQVELTDNKEKISCDGKIIADLGEARLTYRETEQNESAPQIVWHRLITPVGGEYQLILADGTKVWLNANSELSYPVNFTGSSREVRLLGEAYFEVSSDKSKPFRVCSDKFDIVVTGTAFNVSAYPEDRHHRVALVKGGVNIMSGKQFVAALIPGKEINYDISDGQFRINDADLEAITAWKDGLFLFREEPLSSITRKLGRWYNVEFKLQEKTEEKFYSGTIKRDETLENMLNILRLTNEIDFNIRSNREIEVIPLP